MGWGGACACPVINDLSLTFHAFESRFTDRIRQRFKLLSGAPLVIRNVNSVKGNCNMTVIPTEQCFCIGKKLHCRYYVRVFFKV